MKNLTNLPMTLPTSLPLKQIAGILLMATTLIAGCGKGTDRIDTSVSTSDLANDSGLSAGVVNANYSDALAASTSQGTPTTSLLLAGSLEDKSAITRTCAEDGSKAVVQITGAIEKSKIMTSANGKRTMEHNMTGSSTMKRTWSNTTGTAVTCNSAKSAAQINWRSPDNLKLEAEFEREREREMKITTPKFTKEFSEKFKSSGTRTITWGTSSTASDTASIYYRTHTAAWKATREMSVSNENGVKKELKLTIATKSDAPLVVNLERLIADNSVTSKTLVSGTVIAQKDASEAEASDGSIETTYTNLKVAVSAGECAVASGSATIVFKDGSGTTLKTFELSVDSSGDPQLKNTATGTAVDGFDLDGCDPEDMKL